MCDDIIVFSVTYINRGELFFQHYFGILSSILMAKVSNIVLIQKQASIRLLNYIVKVGLFASFFIAIVFSPDVVAGKGMAARAPIFMASSILIPIIFARRKISLFNDPRYPHLADFLLATPFLLDTLGNLLGFYNNYIATDDVLHFLNWLFLIPGIMALVFAKRISSKDFLLIAAGISAMAIIGWEAFEWLISDAGPLAGKTPDALSLSYGDTIGDLVISFSGGFVGSIIARKFYFKRQQK